MNCGWVRKTRLLIKLAEPKKHDAPSPRWCCRCETNACSRHGLGAEWQHTSTLMTGDRGDVMRLQPQQALFRTHRNDFLLASPDFEQFMLLLCNVRVARFVTKAMCFIVGFSRTPTVCTAAYVCVSLCARLCFHWRSIVGLCGRVAWQFGCAGACGLRLSGSLGSWCLKVLAHSGCRVIGNEAVGVGGDLCCGFVRCLSLANFGCWVAWQFGCAGA